MPHQAKASVKRGAGPTNAHPVHGTLTNPHSYSLQTWVGDNSAAENDFRVEAIFTEAKRLTNQINHLTDIQLFNLWVDEIGDLEVSTLALLAGHFPP
jgi:hypothetical protein